MMTHARVAAAVLLVAAALPAGARAQDAAKDVVQQWNAVKAEPAPDLKPVTLDPKTAVIVVMDFNRNNCLMRPRCAAAIPKVQRVIAAARAKGYTLVFIRTAAMKLDDYVPEVAPMAGEPYMAATKEDKFVGTDMERLLKAKGIETVVLMGTQANGSVMATGFGATFRDFKVVVPVDTMPAATAYQEQFAIWEIANGNAFRGLSTLTRSDMITF